MKRRLTALIVVALALIMAAPAAAFAVSPPPAGTVGGTLTVEYRYTTGQRPNVPATITRFGFTYHLISQTRPIPEGTLPIVRTYSYLIVGTLTPEQVASIKGLGDDVNLQEVYVPVEREVDKIKTITSPTNDIDEIPQTEDFLVSKANADGTDGTELKTLALTGVTFELADPPKDKYGIPIGYIATAVYRGIETYNTKGYVLESTYKRNDNEKENVYVIIAEYQTDEMPATIVVGVGGGVQPPLPPGGEELLPPVDIPDEPVPEDIVNGPIQDITDDDVPRGNIGSTGFWSLMSLLFSVVAVIFAIASVIGIAVRKNRANKLKELGSYDFGQIDTVRKRGQVLRILTILAGVVTPLVWVSLDNFNNGWIWVNAFTPIIGILLAVTVILCVLTNMRSKIVLDEDNSDKEASASVA